MSHLQHFATILAAAVALATVLSETTGAERQASVEGRVLSEPLALSAVASRGRKVRPWPTISTS